MTSMQNSNTKFQQSFKSFIFQKGRFTNIFYQNAACFYENGKKI